MRLNRLALALLAVLALALAARSALGQVNVFPATGGGAISADNVGGAWTTLTGPELDETSKGGVGAFTPGTIVLNAPAGFEFNTAATVTVTVGLVSGNNKTSGWIDIGAGPGNPVSASVTATTITITVVKQSSGSNLNSLTWSNIQVRPTGHCLPVSGNISESGTSSFTLSNPDLGTLTEVIGARRMYTVLPGQSFAACSGISGTPTNQLVGVQFNLTQLIVADQWGNVDSSYAGVKTIAYSGPTGTNSYTTSVSFSGGVSGTTLATTINTAQTTTITATDGSVPGAASSIFTVGPAYTHYAITYPAGSTGVTCDVSQVTITAHDANHNPTPPPAGTVLNISTSTGAGVWTNLVAGAGTLSGFGANNGRATYTWAGGESSITLNLRQNTPATINVNLIDSNGKIENSGTEDPSITFANSAFRVTANGSTAASLGTQIAGKPSNVGFGQQTLYLQAIRTDTNTGSCVGLIQNQTVSVGLAASCVNPASCAGIGSTAMTVLNSGGSMVTIPKNNGPGAPASYANVSLAFNASSMAPLVLDYTDAGSMQLYAQYALPSPPSGTYVSGSSNVFVVRPFGLRVSGVPSGLSGPGSAVFKTAGQTFPVTVTGVQWQAGQDANADGVPDSDAQIASDPATPNFGQESTPATVALTSTLAEPSGGSAGTLTVGPFSAFSAGATSANASWSEVGLINLFAASTNYLGSGQNITNSAAGLTGVGRFVPAWFYLQPGASLTNRQAAACSPASTFSYMGEGMGLAFTLTAQNTASQTTQNYTGTFAKLNPALASSFAFGAKSGATNLTGRLSASSVSGTWSNGQVPVQATVAIGRNNTGPNPQDSPDGPYTGVNLGIAPVDSDGVAMNVLDLSVTGGANDHKNLGVSTEVRFGRLACGNALGQMQLALPMPLVAQYWNGSAFVTNAADSCTPITTGNVVYGNYQLNLTPGEVGPPSITSIASGIGRLLLPAPTGGSGNYMGSMTVTVDLYGAAMGYLLGNWSLANPDGNPATAYDVNPSCSAGFGLYGSQPNQFTFLRENY